MASEFAVRNEDADFPCVPYTLEPLQEDVPCREIIAPGEPLSALSGDAFVECELSSIANNRGGGLGSRKSNMRVLPPLFRLSRKLVRENLFHQESLRFIGRGAGSIAEETRGDRVLS